MTEGLVVTIPAVVLGQVWRSQPQPGLSTLVNSCEIEPLSAELAKASGELCLRASTADVVDAAVVAGAFRRRDVVLTADAEDLRHLATFAPSVRILEL